MLRVKTVFCIITSWSDRLPTHGGGRGEGERFVRSASRREDPRNCVAEPGQPTREKTRSLHFKKGFSTPNGVIQKRFPFISPRRPRVFQTDQKKEKKCRTRGEMKEISQVSQWG